MGATGVYAWHCRESPPCCGEAEAYLVDFTRRRKLTTRANFWLRVWHLDNIANIRTQHCFLQVLGRHAAQDPHANHVEHMGLNVTSCPECAACSAMVCFHCHAMNLRVQLNMHGPAAYQGTYCLGAMHTGPSRQWGHSALNDTSSTAYCILIP